MIRFCDKAENEQSHLCKEYVIFRENVFWEAHNILQNYGCEEKVFIRVLDENGEIIRYCYDDQSNKGAYLFFQETVDGLMNSKLGKDILLSRIDLDGKKAIHIFDMNELSLALYKLCVQKEIPVCTKGWGWNILSDDRSIDEVSYKKRDWFYVYAEGRRSTSDKSKRDITQEFLFLVKMGIGMGARRYLLSMIKECAKKEIYTVAVSIPNRRQVSHITEVQRICKNYLSFQEPDDVREKIYGKETVDFFAKAQSGTIDTSMDQYLFNGGGGKCSSVSISR